MLNNQKIMSYFSINCFYKKGMIVYQEHDLCDRIGMIHEGEVQLVHYTLDGEERVLSTLHKGDIFGDFLINSPNPYYSGNLIAMEDTYISFLSHHSLDMLLNSNKDFQSFYLSQLSKKALNLNQHNKILLQSSLREKINMWLSYEIKSQNMDKIRIISKEKLANYLNVARPSLSRELSSMKRDGLIDYDRHYIYLLH